MSEAVAIRVVCEGPTDTIVIRSAVLALGVEAVVTQIQPEDNSNVLGVYGGGWRGVRSWCQTAVATSPMTKSSPAPSPLRPPGTPRMLSGPRCVDGLGR